MGVVYPGGGRGLWETKARTFFWFYFCVRKERKSPAVDNSYSVSIREEAIFTDDVKEMLPLSKVHVYP